MTNSKKLSIGVLAIQGCFKEHEVALLKCQKQHEFLQDADLNVTNVTEAPQLNELDGLVIPGGESTAIRSILTKDMVQKLGDWSKKDDHFLFGTCAGLILLSKNIHNHGVGQFPELGLLDVTTSRNYFGRQLDSFEGPVAIKEKAVINCSENNVAQPNSCNGVFIRAPVVMSVDGPLVKTLATLNVNGNELVVGVQEKNCIGLAFHPELTEDSRWHSYFLKCIMEKKFKT